MSEATTYPCHHETVHCPALRAHLWHQVSLEFVDLAQCTRCHSVFDTAPRCPYCGAASRWLAERLRAALPFDPVIPKAARRMPQIVHELERSDAIYERLAQCRGCGSVFHAAPRCPYCGSEKLSLDEDRPVGCFHDDYESATAEASTVAWSGTA